MYNVVLSPIDPEKLISDISERVTANILKAVSKEPLTEKDCWFDLPKFCDYHPEKPAKATVYGWVNAYAVPFYKKGKKLFFLKSEIDAWLKQGRKMTLAETAGEANQYLLTKKKRG